MTRHIVLASSSPRRQELLKSANWQVEVRPPHADETWPGGPLEDAVIALARRKLHKIGSHPGFCLAADTVVSDPSNLHGVPLGKPSDAADAARMLRQLSGREHAVVTGFVARRNTREEAAAVRTQVIFRHLTDAEIDLYVATQEPMDKAGAYGIQGMGGALVHRITGSYTNVVGLPLAEVLGTLDVLQ